MIISLPNKTNSSLNSVNRQENTKNISLFTLHSSRAPGLSPKLNMSNTNKTSLNPCSPSNKGKYAIKSAGINKPFFLKRNTIKSLESTSIKKEGFYNVLVNFYLAKKFISILKSFTSNRTPKYLNKNQFNMINDCVFSYETYKNTNNKKNSKAILIIKKFTENIMRIINYFSINIGYFDPSKLVTLIWNIFVIISMIFFFIYIPIFICFRDQYFENDFKIETLRGFCLLILLIDGIKCIFTAYYKKGILVTKHRKIILNYFRRNFIYDIFSLGPLVLFELKIIDGHKYEYFEFILLFFFLKLRNFKETIKKFEEIIFIDQEFHNVLALIKLIFQIILLSHIFACFWYFVGTFEYEDSSWLKINHLDTKSLMQKYLNSYYYVCITMNTVGYGDITPQNTIEKIFSIIFIYVACGLFAYSINSIGIILNDINKRENEFLKEINILNDFMKEKKINFDLRMRVRKYIEYIWTEEKIEKVQEQTEIIDKLSDSLKEELLIEANGAIIRDIKFLSFNFSEETLRKTVSIIKEIRYTPGDIIFMDSTDTMNYDLFIIRKGEVELFVMNEASLSGTTTIKTVKKGDFFGELSFFTGKPRKTCARSIDFTTIFCINQDEFMKLIKKNGKDYERYCEIKDSINLYKDYSDLYMKCNSCSNNSHLVVDCPLLHYIPPTEVIVLRHAYSTDQERDINFKRKAMSYKTNSLSKKLIVQSKAIEFQNDLSENESDQKEDSENNESDNSSSDTEVSPENIEEENEIKSEMPDLNRYFDKKTRKIKKESSSTPKAKHIHFNDNNDIHLIEKNDENNFFSSDVNLPLTRSFSSQRTGIFNPSMNTLNSMNTMASSGSRHSSIKKKASLQQKLIELVKNLSENEQTSHSNANNSNNNIENNYAFNENIINIDFIKQFQQYFIHNNADEVLEKIELLRQEKFLKKIRKNKAFYGRNLSCRNMSEKDEKKFSKIIKVEVFKKYNFMKRNFFKNTNNLNKLINDEKFDPEKFKLYYKLKYGKVKLIGKLKNLLKSIYNSIKSLFKE